MPVERIEITSREPFCDGQAFGDEGLVYERLDGIAYYAVRKGS